MIRSNNFLLSLALEHHMHMFNLICQPSGLAKHCSLHGSTRAQQLAPKGVEQAAVGDQDVTLFERRGSWNTEFLFFVRLKVDRVSELCVQVSLQVGHLSLDGLHLLLDGLDIGPEFRLRLLERLLHVRLAHGHEDLSDLERNLEWPVVRSWAVWISYWFLTHPESLAIHVRLLWEFIRQLIIWNPLAHYA